MKRVLILLWLMLWASMSSGQIVVDGDPSEWTGVAPPTEDTFAVSPGTAGGLDEWIWRDAAGDQRTDDFNGFVDPGKQDLLELRLAADAANLYFLARFPANLDHTPGDGALQLQITLRREASPATEEFLANFADARVPTPSSPGGGVPDARWDYLIFTTAGSGGTDVAVWQNGFSTLVFNSGSFALDATSGTYEGCVPWSDLGGAPGTETIVFTFSLYRSNPQNFVFDTGLLGQDFTRGNCLDYVTPTGGNTYNALIPVSDGGNENQGRLDYAVAIPFPIARGTALVINEVDYDQPGIDTAEFVELKNTGSISLNLDAITLEMINGTGGGATVYRSFDLPPVWLDPGDYYVICGNAGNVPNCDLAVSPATNLIQNGAPDALGLRASGVLIDAVSYEGNAGAPYLETSGVGLEDDPAVEAAGISRFPDGIDTDVNNQDFSLRCITPGESNTALAAQCLACEITDLSAGTQTPCDPITNTYTQEVIVSYSNPPATGNLIVNGQSFPITGSPQTVVLTNLPADGLPVDVTAAFSDEASCARTEAALFTAPGGCSEPRSQVVLLALSGSIRLRQGVDVLAGDVIVNQAATGATLNDDVGGAELYVGKRANIAAGYRAMADDILMKTDARIDGEAHYNTLNDTAFGGTVVGSRYTPLALPVFSSLPAFETGTPGSNDVVVAPGDTQTLAPGPYGNLTVGDSATVVFTGGVYDCREIRAGTKARLVFQSLTRVRVAERVAVGRRTYIGPETGAAIDASGIIFFVNGSDGNGTPLTPPPAVDVGNRSEIQANFYAPNGTCELGKRTNFTGAVLAQHIDVGKHAHLTAGNFFGSSAFGKVAASGGPAPGRSNRSLTPRGIRLAQNYPNPFNPRTTIRFYLPQSSSVTLKIFDMSGRLIRTLIREDFPAGEHRVTWDATDDAGAPVASGVYLYRLQVGSTALVRKMTLLR